MRGFARDNSLSIFFLVIFVAALVGQAIAGHNLYNQEQLTHGEEGISLWPYVTSSSFGQAVMENWQSEYLQFMLFMLATVWLLQRGSPESKKPEQAGRESDRRQKVGRESTFQNWQSEFLAVGSFAVLAIYLRQRGSPESKPVGAPHDATGVES